MADASAHGVKLTAKRKNLLQQGVGIPRRGRRARHQEDPQAGRGGTGPNPRTDRNCRGRSEHRGGVRAGHRPARHRAGAASSTKAAVEAFLRREVLPYAPDAWHVPAKVKVGYEISFTRYFYKPQPLRPLEEIRADILALERETEGLVTTIVGAGSV